uniref:Uncharacterized protein n=1 Tax=Aegilops tauschii subsp. strangulata TaxID=200361 RepID=A0A453M9R0_AEGTS
MIRPIEFVQWNSRLPLCSHQGCKCSQEVQHHRCKSIRKVAVERCTNKHHLNRRRSSIWRVALHYK